MRVLVKVGGAALEQEDQRARLARAVVDARAAGHEVILVHGGGRQIEDLARRIGLPSRRHDGLRVTDAEMADVVLMVFGGLVNRMLVASLEAACVPAVGITGADGSTLSARRHAPNGHDLGFVGEVHEVRPALVGTLLAAGYVPVIATTAPLAAGIAGDRTRFYNINADMGAAPLVAALAADVLLFLSDVPAVLDGRGMPLPTLTPASSRRLRQAGVLQDGMLPKVDAALAAAAANPRACVKLAAADRPSAILAALASGGGTRFLAAEAADG